MIDADRAASTSTPGAARSGLRRRSRLGPLLLNGAGGRAGSCPSYAPTMRGILLVVMVPIVVKGLLLLEVNLAWQPRQMSSRSIQA